MSGSPVHVLAGVLRDARGRVLLAQRPQGKDHAGLWEFPGGKREAGETRLAALARELLEELGIEIHDAKPLVAITHAYPHASIRLDAWTVTRWTGEPRGIDGQSLAWVPLAELDAWPMPAADRTIVTALRLPPRYAITPEPDADSTRAFLARFERLIAGGTRLVQLRSTTLDDAALAPIARHCAAIADRQGADLLINGRPGLALALGVGLHLPARMLRDWLTAVDPDDSADMTARDAWLPRSVRGGPSPAASGSTAAGDSRTTVARHARGWFAASCHDADELAMAARAGCDFVTLSPVLATLSHPGSITLGWDGFGDAIRSATVPVYALGGLGIDDEATARDHGARGIAAIRSLWPD